MATDQFYVNLCGEEKTGKKFLPHSKHRKHSKAASNQLYDIRTIKTGQFYVNLCGEEKTGKKFYHIVNIGNIVRQHQTNFMIFGR
jgi:hypothetical protein